MGDTKTVNRAKWRVTIPAFFLLMGFGFVAGDFFFFYKEGPLPENQAVLIPKGSSLKSVTALLAGEGVIEFPSTFYWTARISGAAGNIRAGEFLVPARASQADVLKILKVGEAILHKITFPEGLSSKQVVDLLNANMILAGDVLEIPSEGSLLPETYLFPRGSTKEEILTEMEVKQNQFLADLWGAYEGGLPFNSIEEAIILASIVEEETALPEERPLIAAVFLNRLKKHMRLQSDPTVIYGLTEGYPLGRPLRQSELDGDTPYNTYVHYGLPPGPITNPGRAAIEAVFNPAQSNALYFVADGSGGHVFADTLEEHNENVKKWRKFQRDNDGG
ncbi:MAG: endolytic transglycosylase MltG [Sphingomonadales bacterium]